MQKVSVGRLSGQDDEKSISKNKKPKPRRLLGKRKKEVSCVFSDLFPDPVHEVERAGKFINGALVPNTTYLLGRLIGSGAFGQVRLVRDKRTGDMFAAKWEHDRGTVSQLANEWELYTALHKKPAEGVPKVYLYGRCGPGNVMVIELLGPSLEQIFKLFQSKFSLHTLLLIAVQLITRLEYVHSCHIAHRDVKPVNFLIAKNPKRDRTIYIVDFGVSKYFADPASGLHIPLKKKARMVGTPSFMSINMHKRLEQSRRDDLESVGYSLIYFLRGSLPWQGLQPRVKPYQPVLNMKKTVSLHALCRNEPEFVEYMQYVRKLHFTQKPDYNYLRELFINRMQKEGYDPAAELDWPDKVSGKTFTCKLQRMCE